MLLYITPLAISAFCVGVVLVDIKLKIDKIN